MRDPKETTILVVDDEEPLRQAIVFDLKRKGYQTFEAENGGRAFELVQEHKIDIVLTDVRMPGGDGVELLDNIKNKYPRLPVVMFITGFADITLEDAYYRGVHAVFSKPFDRKSLFSAIANALTDKDDLWALRKKPRLPTDLLIELTFANFSTAVQGKVLNLGQGGMFVSIETLFPEVHSHVEFKIDFQSQIPALIEGQGIVRWVRQATDSGLLTGCGIEFEYLSDKARKQIIELINQLHTKSFIPKT